VIRRNEIALAVQFMSAIPRHRASSRREMTCPERAVAVPSTGTCWAKSATAKSGFPSPFQVPIATEYGLLPCRSRSSL